MRPCCELASNRQTVTQERDRVVQRCVQCGARHIELAVEPILVGITLKG